MNQDELRSALKAGPAPARRGWRCPDDMRLAAFIDGRLEAKARGKVESHLAGCGFCLGQIAAAVQLAEAKPAEVSEELVARAVSIVPRDAPAGSSPPWRWALAATATAGLVLVIVPMLRETRAPSSEGEPVATEQPAAAPTPEPRAVRQLPSLGARPEIEFPREGASVSAQDLEFRWSPMEGTLFYEVSIVTSDGDIVWQGQADTPPLRLPPAVTLMPGRKYYVSVSAYLAEGKTVKSAPAGFDLAAGR